MGTQVKAFALLFLVLIGVDAVAYQSEYRNRVMHGIASVFGSVEGPGHGRDWSKHKPTSNR